MEGEGRSSVQFSSAGSLDDDEARRGVDGLRARIGHVIYHVGMTI